MRRLGYSFERFFRLCACMLLASALLLESGCTRDYLPREKVIDIIQQMYETDVRIRMNPHLEPLSDTTFVYDAVYKANGTTSKQFFRSLNHYLEHPLKFRGALNRRKTAINDQRLALHEVAKSGRERRLDAERFRRRILDSIVSVQNLPAQEIRRRLIDFSLVLPTRIPAPYPDTLWPSGVLDPTFWNPPHFHSKDPYGIPLYVASLQATVSATDSLRAVLGMRPVLGPGSENREPTYNNYLIRKKMVDRQDTYEDDVPLLPKDKHIRPTVITE